MKLGVCRFYAAVGLAALVQASSQCTVLASLPGDEHWDNQFGAAGAGDLLYATATVGNKIYVGGLLTTAVNTKANLIAGYDGTNWFALNNGVVGAGNAFI